MFVPIHLLPRFDPDARQKYWIRWHDSIESQDIYKKIVELIKNGAGEDFLQWDFEHGEFPFLENYHDLKGFNLAGEDITFPEGDNFEVIDFTYASFFNCTFRNATFPGTDFSFSRLEECRFLNCTFGRTDFFGALIQKCEFASCDFIEANEFINCDLMAVKFKDYFTNKRLFYDCRFDAETRVAEPIDAPHVPWNEGRLRLDKTSLAGIYRGEAEAFKAGSAINNWEQAYLRERRALTRYNVTVWREKTWNYFLDYLAGYGLLPLRVLRVMVVVVILSTFLYDFHLSLQDALLLSTGAFFTFGANVGDLSGMPVFFRVLYVFVAFLGVSLSAVFISTLASKWFRER